MPKESKSAWCNGTKPKSRVIKHFQKAKNPPKRWQEENRESREEEK